MKKCFALFLTAVMLLGLIPGQAETITFETPVLYGDSYRQLLKNPNRGFRLETYMSVGSGKYTPDLYTQDGDYKGASAGTEAAPWLINFVYDYKAESPVVAQVYFYLTEYRDRDLDQVAFDHMNEYFETCRKLNITVALRFAYVFTQFKEAKQDVVSLEQMLRHMEQLKPILAANRDVLFCLEGGFFGEWGENSGDSPWVRRGDVSAIMNAMVRMCPEDLPIVVRYDWVREEIISTLRHRVGYHDDYIVGVSHGWSTGGRRGTESYNRVVKNSPRVLVEGEMPWGAQSEELDAWNIARYLHELHFTVLSCYHNYREGGGRYVLRRAVSIPATQVSLKQNKLPIPYDEWFLKADGSNMKRTVFDYIRDFLGYHLQANRAVADVKDGEVSLTLQLTNYGFAAPLAMKGFDAVLVNEQGEIVASDSLCALEMLQPGAPYTCKATLQLPDDGGNYRLGVYLYDYAGTGAKLANDIPFENGVNILGGVK